jgi:hypothetical protein
LGDEESDTILRNCRKATSRDARVLLIEQVITPGRTPVSTLFNDINMLRLTQTGGRQRTVVELLGHLVAKSMVQADKPPETRPTALRYRLRETIRQYAEEKLVEAGEANLARARHRDWFLSFAEQAMEEMEGSRSEAVVGSAGPRA